MAMQIVMDHTGDSTRASLGASAVRYSFTVTDFHRLPFAGLPAHPSIHDPYATWDSWGQLKVSASKPPNRSAPPW
jgi:hypothetical protein